MYFEHVNGQPDKEIAQKLKNKTSASCKLNSAATFPPIECPSKKTVLNLDRLKTSF